MKSTVVFNRRSGSARAREEAIYRLARRWGVAVVPVERGAAMGDTVAGIAADGAERIIVAGGDGTVSLVAGHLVDEFPNIELAVLPLGTGNDFARAVGIEVDHLESAWRQAIGGRAMPLDIGEIIGEGVPYFINVAHGGLSGLAAHDVESEHKMRWGAFAYWMTAVGRLMETQEYRLEVQLDDEVVEMESYGLLVANGRYVGGGFPAAPHAYLNDGWFDVVVIPVLPTLDLIGAGLDFWFGREHVAEQIKIYRSRRVHVRGTPKLPFSVDGERAEALEATFTLLPAAMKFVVGENPPAVLM